MVDARLPDRYLVDRHVLRLTNSQRSSYFMATLWAVANRTDGRVERLDLPLIPTFAPDSIEALVSAGLWTTASEDTWHITDYLQTQTSRSELETLENIRRADREKKRRQREARSNSSPGSSPVVSRGHVPGDSTGQDRQGEDRRGKVTEASEDFVAFWNVYPRKEARADAAKAYRAAVKTASADAILAGAQKYRLSTLGSDPQYWKLAGGWLRARRWEDEPTVAAPSNRRGMSAEELLGYGSKGDEPYSGGIFASMPVAPRETAECERHPGYPPDGCRRCDEEAA